ncbi:hypothetical protein GCM10028895_25490 [Pontibacter rugosus]
MQPTNTYYMELLNIDRSHYLMAFNDEQSMARMAKKCKKSSLHVVYAKARKALDDQWTQELQMHEPPKDSAASVASALNLLSRISSNTKDYYVLVVRKNCWA